MNSDMSDMDEQDEDFDNDFDVEDIDDDFDTFDSGGSSATQSPLFKLMIVGGVILVIIVAIFFFGGSSDPVANSVVSGGQQDLREAPGTEELDPTMQAALEEINEDMQAVAEDTGDSFLPVPITPSREGLPDDPLQPEAEDPLETWKRLQEQQLQQQVAQPLPQQPTGPSEEEVARRQALNDLAQAMSSQMNEIVQNQKIDPLSYMSVTSPPQALTNGNTELRNADGIIDGTGGDTVVQLLPAGTIEYGQTLLEANSDIGGPVLVQIVTGPFAGARAIGSFDRRDKYLVLTFKTLSQKGVTYTIDAIAVDPNTSLTGLATDVDYRLFERIILPAAARFIEGIGSAIADSGNTSVSVNGETVVQNSNDLNAREELFNGVEEGARELGDFLEEQGDGTQILVTVAAGTPIGLLFLEPVFDNSISGGSLQQQNALGSPLQQLVPFGQGVPGTFVTQQQPTGGYFVPTQQQQQILQSPITTTTGQQ